MFECVFPCGVYVVLRLLQFMFLTSLSSEGGPLCYHWFR